MDGFRVWYAGGREEGREEGKAENEPALEVRLRQRYGYPRLTGVGFYFVLLVEGHALHIFSLLMNAVCM